MMEYSAKKMVIAGMIGLVQFSFTLPVLEAASLHNTVVQQEVQLSRHDRDRHDKRYEERKREHDRKLREEKRRHEQEMRRHPGESRWEWERRQERERERHNRNIRAIAALLIGVAIGSNL